ncbi:MAG TPA: hypothetical protein PKU80_10370 [Candidatus Limiplasma sp.]|nr:hypothetical protein [Candidatus Limiplasma sp.]HRX07543.1 hypothetical protein [Candidatus Limiplasma sp.]
MRKIVSLLGIVALLFGIASVGLAESCGRQMPDMEQTDVYDAAGDIGLRYSYTNQVSAYLSFSGDTAYCGGFIDPSGQYDTTVRVSLYKKNGSSWSFIKSWSGSAANGNTASASGTVTVSAGTYKVTTRGNIGGGLEYPSTSVTKTK